MKKIALYVLLILGATFTTVSCSEDFLNVDYYSIVNPDGVYENADNVYAGLIGVYSALYAQSTDINGVWPAFIMANLPSLDMQGDGWDAEIGTHSWTPDPQGGCFKLLWQNTYIAIVRANLYLAALENVGTNVIPEATKKVYEAEVRGIRGYCYYLLTTNFSRVPMLLTGETYANTPDKARPDSDDDAWAAILDDLEYAASVLDWKPANDEYGRFTKAAALAYAAKSHMYRKEYDKAKTLYKQIIDGSGKSLNPVQVMNTWLDNPNSYETIWEISFPQFPDMNNGTVDPYKKNYDVKFFGQQTRPNEYGGWGDAAISYEFVRCFEPGDKRLKYNVAGWHGTYGDTNPFIDDPKNNTIGVAAAYKAYFDGKGKPNNHSMKYWKSTDYNEASSLQLYRYTGVLLDYAECCFRTGAEPDGWKVLKEIRNRAFGNLEVGYNPNDHTNSVHEFPVSLLNTELVAVPDAKEVYTAYKAKKGYKSDAWVVALFQERRKEFVHEFSIWYDLCRFGSDFVQEWLDCEYPQNGDASFMATDEKYIKKNGSKYYVPSGSDKNEPYTKADAEERAQMIPVTGRNWEWDPIHLVYPIPTPELTANKLCTQNEGY